MKESRESLPAAVAMACIEGYKRTISPRFAPRCVFVPTCSTYAILAIESQGLIRGSAAALRRILRCRPKNLGVIDYPAGVKHESKSQ